MDTKSGSSFGPFLETLKSRQAARTEVAREARRTLLTTLAKTGPSPIEKLRHHSQMRFETFADILKDLKGAELIRIDAESGEEIVSLTDKGEQFSSLDW